MQKQEIQAKFFQLGQENLWQKIEPLLKPSIRIQIERASEDDFFLGQSRIGGHPDLPLGFKWADLTWKNQPLSFIAQFSLAELAPFDVSEQLPKEGWLSFFYPADEQPYCCENKTRSEFKIIYSKQEPTQRYDYPEDLPVYLSPARLHFSPDWTLPDYDALILSTLALSDQEKQMYKEVFVSLQDESQPIHRLLGHADQIQPNDLGQLCTLYEQDLSPSKIKRAPQKFLKDALSWELLLQLDTLEEADMAWGGDGGRLYFFIREQDLKNHDFTQAWFLVEDN